MAKDIVGTPRKVTLDGTTFDVMSDANFTEMGSQYEKEGIATSGRTMQKRTKRSKTVESVTLACNGDERALLEELDERLDNFPISYENASEDVYRTDGFISFEQRETETFAATITMHPAVGNQWEAFIAA